MCLRCERRGLRCDRCYQKPTVTRCTARVTFEQATFKQAQVFHNDFEFLFKFLDHAIVETAAGVNARQYGTALRPGDHTAPVFQPKARIALSGSS
jgi:hypothetical protein